jgi:hypothetical protein
VVDRQRSVFCHRVNRGNGNKLDFSVDSASSVVESSAASAISAASVFA